MSNICDTIGCNNPTYSTTTRTKNRKGEYVIRTINRTICHECVKKEQRERNKRFRKYHKKNKPKIKKKCLYCCRDFETSRDNQKFCHKLNNGKNSCHSKYHYEKSTFSRLTRVRAIDKVHDKGKKRVGGYLYTQKEISYIIKNYHKKNAVEIAKYLDRPVNGVRDKIRKLKYECLIYEKNL